MAIDVLALGASKDFTKQVALGLSDISIDNVRGIVTFTLNDGSSASWTFPTPADGKDGKDGVSIVDVEQVDSNHFRCVFSNGTYSESIKMPAGEGGGGSYDDTEIRQEIASVSTVATRATEKATEAEAIAKGRSKGYVFDTVSDLDDALEDDDFKSKLLLGDNLYIRALNVPDYWWDGNRKQQLETQKVDLNESVYSLDETAIGTFLGKTLYRKVIKFETVPKNTSDASVYDLTSLNIDYMRDIHCIIKNKDNATITMDSVYVNSAGNYRKCIFFKDNHLMYGQSTNDLTALDVVIEYTKTTD